MSKHLVLDPIDGYIKEISDLLPYPEKIKAPVLAELRSDVLDAMGSDKRPPSIVFGPPVEVAKNISVAHDWKTRLAGWGTRFLAAFIDLVIISGVFVFYTITRRLLVDFDLGDVSLDYSIRFSFGFLFIGIPVILFILGYFIVLEKTYSTTPGKRLLGLRVVHEAGIKITWTQAVIRNITKVPVVGGFLPFDILFGILSEKTRGRKQRVLDFVAGTIVVQQTRDFE